MSSELKASAAAKHIENMIHHLEVKRDSPVWPIRFKDQSEFRFNLVEGRIAPRLHGSSGSMADACLKDIDVIEATQELCVFRFKDGTKAEIDLRQEGLKVQWTKHPKIMGDMPQVIITSNEVWSVFSLFDPNAFPKNCAKLANGCANKAALIFSNFQFARDALSADTQRLLGILNNRDRQLNPLTGVSVDEIQFEYDSMGLTVAVNGFLTELKSFLDSYAFLMCKLTGAGSKADFGKAKVDAGDTLSGGCIINALRRKSPVGFTNGNVLADLIERRSREWMAKTVGLRDEAVHAVEIGSLRRVRGVARKLPGNALYTFEMLPVVIAETPLLEYFARVIEKLRDFIVETQAYLPGVNRDSLLPKNFVPLAVSEVLKSR
jgi:hypothetical protein